MVTLEDIENEIDPSKQTGIKNKIVARFKADFLNNLIKKLKKQEELLKEIPDVKGEEIIKALINGNRQLSSAEIDAATKKFGSKGIMMLEGMGSLNRAQRQWIFKQMGWDVGEVG
jgi:hypothetical protein